MYQHPASAANRSTSSSSRIGCETHFFFKGIMAVKSSISQSRPWARALSTITSRFFGIDSNSPPPHIRWAVHKIVFFFQGPQLKIFKDSGKPPFHFSQKDGIGMQDRFIGVKHDGDSAEYHRNSQAPVVIGNLKGARKLAGQHDGDGDQV